MKRIEEIVDIITCVAMYDDEATDEEKARYFDIIQRDIRKLLNMTDNE
jgi:tellurite resistance protein